MITATMRPRSRPVWNRQAVKPADRRGADGPPLIVGYAAVFGVLSTSEITEGGRRFREVIRPGAFAAALRAGQDVRAVVDHDPFLTLATSRGGGLSLWEDARGLAFQITPPDDAFGEGVADRVKRRALPAASFKFTPGAVEWKGDVRHVLTVKHLVDVSLSHSPAYRATAVGLIRRGASADHRNRALRLLYAEASL